VLHWLEQDLGEQRRQQVVYHPCVGDSRLFVVHVLGWLKQWMKDANKD
jgi:hypothetical protein